MWFVVAAAADVAAAAGDGDGFLDEVGCNWRWVFRNFDVFEA